MNFPTTYISLLMKGWYGKVNVLYEYQKNVFAELMHVKSEWIYHPPLESFSLLLGNRESPCMSTLPASHLFSSISHTIVLSPLANTYPHNSIEILLTYVCNTIYKRSCPRYPRALASLLSQLPVGGGVILSNNQRPMRALALSSFSSLPSIMYISGIIWNNTGAI